MLLLYVVALCCCSMLLLYVVALCYLPGFLYFSFSFLIFFSWFLFRPSPSTGVVYITNKDPYSTNATGRPGPSTGVVHIINKDPYSTNATGRPNPSTGVVHQPAGILNRFPVGQMSGGTQHGNPEIDPIVLLLFRQNRRDTGRRKPDTSPEKRNGNSQKIGDCR